MIRSLQLNDKPAVIAISQKLWEGDDYIPYIFDQWVEETRGQFVGYWHKNQLVGFGKLSFLTEHDAWLEGLRKDIDSPIRGVARILTQYFLDYLRTVPNLHSLRFATYVGNQASIVANEKMGFEKILTLSLKYQELANIASENRCLIPSAEISLPDFASFIQGSQFFKLTKQFLCDGWVVYPANSSILALFYQNHHYAVLQHQNIIDGLVLYHSPHQSDTLYIPFLEAHDRAGYLQLLKHVFAVAAAENRKEIEIMLPEIPLLREVITELGFNSWEQEQDFFLYEYPLARLRS